MLKTPSKIRLDSQVTDTRSAPATEETPFLYFACQDKKSNSLTHFPALYEYQYRFKNNSLDPMPEFFTSVEKARKRVFVLDKSFFTPDSDDLKITERYYSSIFWPFYSLLDNNPVPEIKILTSNDKSVAEFRGHVKAQLRDKTLEYEKYFAMVKISDRLRKCDTIDVHDRFAIVDDTLWHFGAKVGGMHCGISAASGGWSAQARNAISAFEEIWHAVQGE